MKRRVLACVAFLMVSAVLRADVTITQTMTIEGPAAAMLGGGTPPRIVLRVKGTKMRSETDMMGQSAVVVSDLATRQMIRLNDAEKSARILDAANPAIPAGTPMPETTDVTFKPTGQKRTIDDIPCDEYAITMSLDLSALGGQMPPETAQMLQGVKLLASGSSWLARTGPGIPEYTAYQKAAVEANMMATVTAVLGSASNGFDRVVAASAAAQGLPYLTEMTMSLEGTGQFAEVMKQLGTLKVTNKVTSISTEVLSDDLFKVPAGYTMVK